MRDSRLRCARAGSQGVDFRNKSLPGKPITFIPIFLISGCGAMLRPSVGVSTSNAPAPFTAEFSFAPRLHLLKVFRAQNLLDNSRSLALRTVCRRWRSEERRVGKEC